MIARSERERRIVDDLLAGNTVKQVSRKYFLPETKARAIAHDHGLEFTGVNQWDGRWQRKEGAPMEDWNMPVEDYEALLRKEAAPSPDGASAADPAVPALPVPDMSALDPEEAAAGAGEWNAAVTLIRDLTAAVQASRAQVSTLEGTVSTLEGERETWRETAARYQADAEAYWELRRQQEAHKIQVSRGMLRRAMDDGLRALGRNPDPAPDAADRG